MKFCQPHWEKLKAAIAERGLSHLIAKDGKEALQRTVRELKGENTKTDYDPLMAAHWAIVENALKVFGLGIMYGEICPLCTVDENQAGAPPNNTADDWIRCASDAQFDYAKQNNLQG